MMNALARLKPFALILVVVSCAASAQNKTFAVNPDASEVKMTLKTNHEIVNGSFHVESGSIQYNPSATQISGSVVVAAGSGNTGNESRDKKMNKDILKTQQFTTVTFTPKSYTGSIAPTGDSTIEVAGVMTLLGTPHDITLPMQLHLDGANTSAKTHFIIPYVQWGLKNPSFLVWKAENEVAIDVNMVGHLSN